MDVPYTRKERNDQKRRAEAMIAAQQQRSKERMAANLDSAAPARTVVPKAEHPEPSPDEKFAGRAPHYDDRLDPCSPHFDRSTW